MLIPAFFKKFERGYTMIEMTVVGAIIITGSVVAIPMTMQMVRNAKGDSALEMTTTFLETARNRAVAERRNFRLTFVSENMMTIERVEVPSGLLTVVDTLRLEDETTFMRANGLPDTPDRFGGLEEINFTGDQPVMFTSDGSLIDAAGDVTNGTIYIGKADSADRNRAITITGMTGLVREWKWRGSVWQQ